MLNKQLYCPIPQKWNEIYSSLIEAWKSKKDNNIPKPPIPLILAAWWETGLIQKNLRWLDTIEWAKQYGFENLIPDLNEDEKFFN